jgi:hypothetical protein
VVLVGDEAAPPYERPPLSKDYLRGEKGSEAAVHEQGFCDANGIELLTATVTGQTHIVRLPGRRSGTTTNRRDHHSRFHPPTSRTRPVLVACRLCAAA